MCRHFCSKHACLQSPASLRASTRGSGAASAFRRCEFFFQCINNLYSQKSLTGPTPNKKQGVALEGFLDFGGSVLAHYVKLTASLVVTSEFLRVILVYELSREVCRPSGGRFRRCRFFEKSSRAIPCQGLAAVRMQRGGRRHDDLPANRQQQSS